MLNTKTTLIALFSAAMLTACGGGGGDGTAADAGTDGGEGTTVDARTKYVGTWQADCTPTTRPGGIQRHEIEQIDIRLQGESSLALTSTEILFLDSACTQAATGEIGDTTQATLIFVGSTKTLADGKVVDKVRTELDDLNPDTTTVTAILYMTENKTYVQINDPDEPSSVDSEGYPESLDLTAYVTKVAN